MLKIAEQKGVGDQYTAEQFFTLSQLMYVSIIWKNGFKNNFNHDALWEIRFSVDG